MRTGPRLRQSSERMAMGRTEAMQAGSRGSAAGAVADRVEEEKSMQPGGKEKAGSNAEEEEATAAQGGFKERRGCSQWRPPFSVVVFEDTR